MGGPETADAAPEAALDVVGRRAGDRLDRYQLVAELAKGESDGALAASTALNERLDQLRDDAAAAPPRNSRCDRPPRVPLGAPQGL